MNARQQSSLNIIRVESRRVPDTNVLQSIRSVVLSREIQDLLGTLNSDWRLASQQSSDLHSLLDGLGLVLQNAADEAELQCLLSTEDAGSHGDVLDPGVVADNLWKAGESSDISGNADVDLLDGELSVCGANADICAAGHVNGETERDSVCNDNDS